MTQAALETSLNCTEKTIESSEFLLLAVASAHEINTELELIEVTSTLRASEDGASVGVGVEPEVDEVVGFEIV